MFIFIFFFKQKTAYEMRISDWSSDVCSSDLTSSKHAFALGQTTTPPPPVTLTAPDLKPPAPLVGLWDVEGAVTGDGYAAISVAGTIEFPGADSVVVQYRLEGETDWTMAGEFPAISPFQQVIAPLEIGRASGRDRVGPYV